MPETPVTIPHIKFAGLNRSVFDHNRRHQHRNRIYDRQTVVDAYPNAKVTYDESGKITSVEDSQLGILVKWSPPVYLFPGSVSMEIYTPPPTLPEDNSIHVADIDVTIEKIKSRRYMIVVVSVQGKQDQRYMGQLPLGHGLTRKDCIDG